MQPATVVLVVCGTLLTNGELHHEHQAEAQLDALTMLSSSRLLADSSYMLEFLVQLSVLLAAPTLSLSLYYGGAYYWCMSWTICGQVKP